MLRERLARPAEEVAPTLLGCVLTHTTDLGTVSVEITEVEAYAGAADPASHAHRGPTARNRIMFGAAGRLYVYRSYGIHWCANVVTGPPGEASAVLLRAGRVLTGEDLARGRRGERVPDRGLARGPANLCQALGLDHGHNGWDLLDGPTLHLGEGRTVPAEQIATGPRVGVSLAADVPWRFWVAGERTVSAYKRSPRAQ